MKEQTFANHARYVPGYHVVASILLVLAAGGAVWNVARAIGRGNGRLEAATVLFLALGAMLLFWYARVFPLRAQDRAIRAEENLRHFVITGKLLDPALTPGQIVALRFAPDDELPVLAERAARESLPPSAIKQAIRVWRADHHRV